MPPLSQPRDNPADLPDPRVIYADARVAVVDKPAGMLSVPGKSVADCAAARVARMFPHARGPLVAHRLDMDTSGILIFGLDPGSQRHLSQQFERRRTFKLYRALIAGTDTPDRGTIDLPIRPDFNNRPIQIVDHHNAPPSITHYRVLARETDRTRIELIPITGRTHQLRVHASHPDGLNAPILGDPLYARANSTFNEQDAPRLMLHAHRLDIRLPGARRVTSFVSDVPF